MSSPFDREAPCPNCGAPLRFKFAKALTQVCRHCRFLVARTDRSLVKLGQAADLAEIPTPFVVGAEGTWAGQPFYVEGRVQLDRVNAPGAPWQEYFIWFHTLDQWCWVAFAQGRWYSTTEVENPPPLPPVESLRPGASIVLAGLATLRVVEVGQRVVVSGEGELPAVAPPGVPTWYADVAGPSRVFGTLDYGDGASIPEKLFLGQQFDPADIQLAGGLPLEMPKAEVAACECPSCGGSLPLVTPATTERIICKYCGTVSDVAPGAALTARGQVPKLLVEPYIPLGTQGHLRGMQVICIGFLVRGLTGSDGLQYMWHEYLLYAGESVGYRWLIDENGTWSTVTPIAAGELDIQDHMASFRGESYFPGLTTDAFVDQVVGELYWKVEVGETVKSTDYSGPKGTVSVERTATEVTYSFAEKLPAAELAQAFNVAPPVPRIVLPAGSGAASREYARQQDPWGDGPDEPTSRYGLMMSAIIVILMILMSRLDHCDGTSSGGVYVGPGFGGK